MANQWEVIENVKVYPVPALVWNGSAWVRAVQGESRPPSAAVVAIASSVSNVTLASANTSRLGLTIFNDSTQVLYVKFGAVAQSTDFSVKMVAGAYFELPYPNYTGTVDGIWGGANGNALVTELT